MCALQSWFFSESSWESWKNHLVFPVLAISRASWAWCLMLLILALGMLGQEDNCDFETSLGNGVRFLRLRKEKR